MLLTDKKASSNGNYTISELKEQHKYLTDDEISKIVLRYQSGASTYYLAKEFNCHRSTTIRNLKKQGFKVTTEKSKRADLIEKVISMYADWQKPKDIGAQLGIHASTVLRILKDNNFPIRKSYEYQQIK